MSSPSPFYAKGKCHSGGIYFTDIEKLSRWTNYRTQVGRMVWCWDITISDDAHVYIEENKYKADKIIMTNKRKIEDMDYWKNLENCLNAFQLVKNIIAYAGKIQPHILLKALEIDIPAVMIYARMYPTTITQEIQVILDAVKDPSKVAFIKNPSYKLYLALVQCNMYILDYIKLQDKITCDKLCRDILDKHHSYIFHLKNKINISDDILFDFLVKYPKYNQYSQLTCNISYNNYLELIKRKFNVFRYLHKTQKLCDDAIKINAKCIRYIPRQFQNQYMCDLAYEHDWRLMKHFAPQYQTYDMKMFVINKSKIGIRCITNPTKDMILLSLKKYGEVLKYVTKYITSDICMEVIKYNGMEVRYVPFNCRNNVIMLLAVTQNGMALQYIHRYHQTKDMCIQAVTQNGMALQYCINKFKNPEVYNIAIQQNSMAIQYINTPDDNMKIMAVKSNGLSIKHIEYPDYTIMFEAITQNPLAIKYIKNPNESLCKLVLSKNPATIAYIDKPSFYLMDIYRRQLAIMKLN